MKILCKKVSISKHYLNQSKCYQKYLYELRVDHILVEEKLSSIISST